MPPARWCLAAALAVACGSAGRGAGPAVPDAMTDAPDAQPRTDAGDAEPPTEGGDVEESTDAAGDGPPNCDGPLAFADPIVEAGVRKAAGINDGPLTSQNVAAVTLLVARGAHSLGGLECVINLEVIAATAVTTCTPRRGLKGLDQRPQAPALDQLDDVLGESFDPRGGVLDRLHVVDHSTRLCASCSNTWLRIQPRCMPVQAVLPS